MHSEALYKAFQTICSNLEFLSGQKWLIFKKKPWTIINEVGDFVKIRPFLTF